MWLVCVRCVTLCGLFSRWSDGRSYWVARWWCVGALAVSGLWSVVDACRVGRCGFQRSGSGLLSCSRSLRRCVRSFRRLVLSRSLWSLLCRLVRVALATGVDSVLWLSCVGGCAARRAATPARSPVAAGSCKVMVRSDCGCGCRCRVRAVAVLLTVCAMACAPCLCRRMRGKVRPSMVVAALLPRLLRAACFADYVKGAGPWRFSPVRTCARRSANVLDGHGSRDAPGRRGSRDEKPVCQAASVVRWWPVGCLRSGCSLRSCGNPRVPAACSAVSCVPWFGVRQGRSGELRVKSRAGSCAAIPRPVSVWASRLPAVRGLA